MTPPLSFCLELQVDYLTISELVEDRRWQWDTWV